MIQSQSTTAVAAIPSKSRKNLANIVESAATGSSQPRTYISSRVSRASKPTPLTNPTSLPLQNNAECLFLALEQSYSPLEDSKRAEMAIMSLSRMSYMWPAGCAMFFPVYTSSKSPVFERTWTDSGVTFMKKKITAHCTTRDSQRNSAVYIELCLADTEMSITSSFQSRGYIFYKASNTNVSA